MRVLVFDGPHRLHLEDRPTPQPGAGEVLLRMACIGICGSDLHGYTGASGRRQPGMVMGHEASGWVEACGPGVDDLRIGGLVTFLPTLPCPGTCGHSSENACTDLQVIGVTPSLQGAFADALVVPAERVVPVDLPPETAAAIEPFAVGLHAVRRAGVARGARVLVIGGGMIGLCTALAARLEGAREVVVSDPLASRRSLADELGLRAVEPEAVSGLGGFHHAIDAVGVSATADAALRAVPPGGTVCFVGLGKPAVTVPLFEIVAKERTVVGSFAYPDATFREAAGHLEAGGVDLGPLLGTVVGLADAPAAFAGLANGSVAEVKITVSTGASPPSPGAPA